MQKTNWKEIKNIVCSNCNLRTRQCKSTNLDIVFCLTSELEIAEILRLINRIKQTEILIK